ncbi:TlpA disulfide reductase family protein [Flavobacterium sp.]|uniref:TlpA family protein disulfide reductase n=1 Tax=Flavobacterium sp. TaxID=239 RepID=UPI0022BD626B|nr:TlpA disulfide reductase family protein [Flavobacterium sp.]MCZ8088994.1 TlpA disulfide reductase family protein [Flavobacterium sp.]
MFKLNNFIKVLVLFNCSLGICQTTVVKYIGQNDDKIILSYNFIEFDDDTVVLDTINRMLSVNCSDFSVFSSNDISRRTVIFSECNDTIDFFINTKNQICYSSSNNKFRKLESDYINECFERFGPNETVGEREILNSVLKKSFSIDYNYTDELAFLELSYKNNQLSEAFYNYHKNVYWSLSMLSKLEKNVKTQELLAEIENSFSNSNYLLNIYEYRRLITFYNELLLKNTSNIIYEGIKEQNIIDYLLYSKIKGYFYPYSNEIVSDQQVNFFKKNCKNLNFLKEIEEDLLINDNQITLSDILSRNKGKMILLDFWASWCKPCIEEFPYQKKIIEKYPEISFVFVSIDKSQLAWKKAIKRNLKIIGSGKHYLLKKSSTDIILKKIKLSEIPRYVLIDKNGNIVNNDLPRPSDKTIEKKIELYLK